MVRRSPTTAHASHLTKDHVLPGTSATTMPKLIYGTAWKKDRTADLVFQAIKNGFRGIDTAAQPKHYQEAGVASGVKRAISEGLVKRSDLFIQTKFTSPSGQNETAPYDFNAPLAQKVHQSVQSSLRNFTVQDGHEPYLDSLVLHSPLDTLPETLEAWAVLETYVPHQIRNLGISNTDADTYTALAQRDDPGSVKPAVVQNRFYRDTAYEGGLRRLCADKSVVFQAFWTLLPNRHLVASGPVEKVALGAGVGRIEAYYALILGLGATSVLDGTTSEEHMVQDLKGLEDVGAWAEGSGKEVWTQALEEFRSVVDAGR